MTVKAVRCVVESMNYSACALKKGDYFDVDAAGLHLPDGQSFCFFAIAAVLPLVNGKIGHADGADALDRWLETRPTVQCPDPPEALRMRLEAAPHEAVAEEDTP